MYVEPLQDIGNGRTVIPTEILYCLQTTITTSLLPDLN